MLEDAVFKKRKLDKDKLILLEIGGEYNLWV